ncbi:MAG TPA: glycosyltransferase family 39 protein [Candidatus Acidoferrum sp.]|nr:glycosyltransferase family 39 protein [Candidatus Acidoferrum sp.]
MSDAAMAIPTTSTAAGEDGRPAARARADGRAIVAALASVKLVLHLATAGVYGFFIDELYFLACGEHLAWGYVDMPPLTAFQAWLTRHLFGDSPYSIRLFPSLAGAGLVLLAGALARALGGGRFAQALAGLAVLGAPVYLAVDSYLSMNSIEPLAWMGCALLVVRMVKTGDTRLWMPFGLLSGIGILNKHTMLLFGFALVAGLVLTPERRLLRSRWLWTGGAIAFLVALPNLVWNVRHHFPMLELLANIRRDGRDVNLTLAQFLGLEALFLNPMALPLWLLGLGALLRMKALRPFRALGFAYLVTFGVLAATPGSHKSYYLAPAYPMLFGAGAVALEAALARRPRLSWLKAGWPAAIGISAALIAPTIVPVLPPDAFFAYQRAMPIAQPRLENRRTNAMPQLFADRFGWPEMTEAVARAYRALPAEERARTAIFANDYGQGGAIDFYGPRYGLPKAIGGHLTYWYWGPRGYTGESMLVLGDTKEGASRWFESVEEVGRVGHPYAMQQEQFPILLCHRPKGWTLPAVWPQLKSWD